MFQVDHKKPRGFHKKPAQRSQEENKINLGARHEQRLKLFEQAISKTLPTKEKQLQTLEKQIEKLLETQKKNGRLNFVEQEQLFELRQEIKELQDEIAKLKSREEENEYLLKTAHVIAEYNSDEPPPAGLNNSAVGLTKWMKKDQPETTAVVNETIIDSAGETTTLKNWMRGEKRPKPSQVDRRELLEAWCIKAIPNYVASKPFCHEKPNKCPDPECGSVNQIANSNSGRVNCAVCGTEIDVTFAPSHTSFKETKTTELVPEFPYKRINHFQEWLSQIQGKQNTEIMENVFNGLKIEFKKNQKQSQDLTPKFVKSCLRKLGFTKYYEHAEYIIHHFNGLPPPVLTVETEEEYRDMFREIQIPFALCKPPDRKNFLSYSYIFHQFSMLNGQDHLLEHFPLLKSRPKRKIQDDIWKNMCKLLRWQFIPTV
jgi:hypothetical protein